MAVNDKHFFDATIAIVDRQRRSHLQCSKTRGIVEYLLFQLLGTATAYSDVNTISQLQSHRSLKQ